MLIVNNLITNLIREAYNWVSLAYLKKLKTAYILG
jgi:hypothetical protein